ncbi:MAG: hypothetical protein H7242_03295 [Microbacteriaceae bacterium]|nr:hypothetical protein [Burkholderiaceae bacterium]
MRDNPEGVNAICKTLLAKTAIPPERYKDVLFVNSPAVVDKINALYNDRLFPPSQCPNPVCKDTGTKAPTKKLRDAKPGTPCPGCATPLLPYPSVVEIAPGIHGILTEFNGSITFPTQTPFEEEPESTGLEKQKAILAAMMKSLGATPSMYQAFKAANADKDTLSLLGEPVRSDDAVKKLSAAAKAQFASLGRDHPMRVVADAAANLVGGLADALAGPAPITLPADVQKKYLLRRSRLEASLATFDDARSIEELKAKWIAFDKALATARTEADTAKWDTANAQLDTAEALAKDLRIERMNRDPLLANSLAQLEQLMSLMPAMANDTPRFTKLFDLLTDEMHIILSRTRPYDDAYFKQAAAAQLEQRAPSMATLAPDVDVTPHMVSSGMDAVTTGVVAARLALGEPAQIVDKGANYFETPFMLDHTSIMGETGRVIVGSLNPSTPTTPPSDVATLITKVTDMLAAAETPTTQFALVVDVTIEKGTDGGATDVDLLFSNPLISAAINAGRLSVTVCKSYQKYPGLGVGKVMAGSTTTIAKKGSFPGSDEFLGKVDKEQNYMQNDESQLMTHLVDKSGAQEIALEGRAATNAGKLAAMVQRQPGDPIAAVNPGLPFVLVADGATPMIGPDKRPIPMAKLMPLLGVEERDSFGFQNSSYLEIPAGIRINTGQESEGSLTEKFHALCNVGMKGQTANTDAQKHHAEVMMPAYRLAEQVWHPTKEGPKPVQPPQPKSVEFNVAKVFESLDVELKRFESGSADGPALVADSDTLAQKIAKLAAAHKPQTDPATMRTSDDPQKLVDSMTHGPQAKKLGKVNNEIASYLLLANGMNDCQGDSGRSKVPAPVLAETKAMHEAFIEGGMAAVSPEVRAQLIGNWMKLGLAIWPTEEAASTALAAKLAQFADKLPYREDKAKALMNAVSEAEFAKIPGPAQRKIVGSLYGTLDIESKLTAVDQLLKRRELAKAAACVGELEKLLASLKDGSYEGLNPQALGAKGAVSAGTMVTPREMAALAERIAQAREALTALQPKK